MQPVGAFARGLWPGIKLGWLPIALVVLAHVPGRRVYAANEALHGRPAWQFFCAGLLGDLLYVGPPVLLAFVLPMAIGAALSRWRPNATTVARRATTALAIALLVPAWLFSVGAIESKLERGLYPTYLETKLSLESTTFVTGSLPTLLLDRYWKTSAIVIVASALLLYFHGQRARRDVQTVRSAFGFGLAGLALLGCTGEIVRRERSVFPRTGGYSETRSPIEVVALGRFPFPNHTPITDGMRALFSARTYSPDEKRAGLRALGYDEARVDRLIAFEKDEPCDSPHPLARPLDRVPKADADDLLGDFEALSAALFDGKNEPIVVWQVAMESFRADEVHAIQPSAPPELTPVMERLYADRERTIAFRHAFQGGFRTAQALSALQCGIGSLPFNIATARDMGHFPVRCLPDVLSDAGLETRVFYASDLAYDSMLDFFRYHGVETTQGTDMPPGLPIGSWRGVADRALYSQALAHAESESAARERPLYEFVLTLSGHTPYSRPDDMPPEVAERAAQACKKSASAAEDDCRHLAVMAYADDALGEFLDKLEKSKLARRSIVIISADHATSEMFLWRDSVVEKGRAHVPYVVYLPKALSDSAAHPEALAHAGHDRRERAARQVISLSDSPTLVTSLLASTRELKSIPEPWRFHTYGGQATSPHFTFDAKPSARIWGTDSAAFVFSADADGSVTAYEHKNRAFSEAAQLDDLNPSLRGPAAFLGSFVKGYLTRCEGQAKLRMKTTALPR
jgi:hypothetical protein